MSQIPAFGTNATIIWLVASEAVIIIVSLVMVKRCERSKQQAQRSFNIIDRIYELYRNNSIIPL